MKTLIIHPTDSSTDFLKPIYAPILNKTIINGGIRKSELQKLIEEHKRVIMLGHGTPGGLLAVGQFPDADYLIIDDSFAELLSTRKDNIFIWCNADQYVHRNRLNGFCSGMFISEPYEAMMFNIWDFEKETLDESNYRFSKMVGEYINEPLEVLFENVLHNYRVIAKINPIAKFNLNRLYYQTNIIEIDRGSINNL